jgi:chemotaxis protein CheD
VKLREARAWRQSPDAPDAATGPLFQYDRHVHAMAAKVLPGEYLVTDRDVALVTLLGSCVSACLRDPLTKIGGMNHFMLPEDSNGVVSASARYGSYAMEKLVNEILKLGGARARLEAKVFGGGNVLRGFTTRPVGERNVEFVREYLERERIPTLAEDLLDVHPRKVWFFPATGRVLVRSLPVTPDAEVLRLDRLYQQRLEQGEVNEGSVELFG